MRPHRMAVQGALFLALFLCFLSSAEGESDRPAQVVVNPNPRQGSVLIYSESGKLVQTGATRQQFSLPSGRYTFVVRADDSFLFAGKAEQELFLSAGRSYVIEPPQKKILRTGRLLFMMGLAVFATAGLSFFFMRSYLRKKLGPGSPKIPDAMPEGAGEEDAGKGEPGGETRCFSLQQCSPDMRKRCAAFSKKTDCWSIEITPCCDKDRALCVVCPSYSTRLTGAKMHPGVKEHMIASDDGTLLEKLSNPQMMLLQELSASLSTLQRPEELTEVFFTKLREVIPYDAAALFVVERETGRLALLRSFHREGLASEKRFIDFSAGINLWIAGNRFPMPLHLAKKDKLWPVLFPKEYERSLLEKFELLYPLVDERGKLLGLILIGSKTIGEGYKAQEINIISLTSRILGISLEKSLSYKLANHDGLTGLFVVRYFHERLKEELAAPRSFTEGCSLLLFDIDHFKKFNDTFGHQQGDAVLRGVAALIKSGVKAQDIAARYGGEEMVIALPSTERDAAYNAAERIRKVIESSPFLGLPDDVRVTVSIGVASYPRDAQTPEDLIARADKALYRAKHEGRNRTCLY
ncbi:MAG: sensor domain-containing diguanylate cyclase [Candidatus Eremiobacteraeota bacterium]|nr:sensor domain-containing diguanylate cyclase [Candidatus Eremiobacteraeota bacterium]